MKQRRIQGWLAASLLVASFWSGTPAFASGLGKEVKVVANQPQPSNAGIDISKKYVVWIAKDDKENAVVLLDFDESKETRIGNDGHPKTNPQVDDNYAAWIDQKNGNGEIVVYDIDKKKEKRLTSGAVPSELSLGGNYLVWTDKRDGGSDIYAYDIKNEREFRVSTSGKASHPSVSKTYIAWQDERNGNSDIYFYNITEQKEGYATLNKGDQTNPYVATGTIVYEDGNTVAYYDLSGDSTKKPLGDGINAKKPLIYDDYIVYQTKGDLKYYDLSKKRSFSISGRFYDKIPPAIYGDYVIYAKLNDDKVPTLYMYDLDNEENISLGGQSGDPVDPSGDDRYVTFISEGKNDNTVILVDMKTGLSTVVSDSKQDPKRPIVSGSYVVFYDDEDEELVSYNIKTGKRDNITDKKKNEADSRLYELYGNKLVWVDKGRSYYVNVTDLSKGKTSEIASYRQEIRNVDINERYIAWMTDEGGNSRIYTYDMEDDYESEVTEGPVNAESMSLGRDFVVWSQKDKDWDLYYSRLDSKRIFPLLQDAEQDQVRPQASGDLILFEDNRYQRNPKVFEYKLFDMDEGRFSDYDMSEDAKPSNLRLDGNRLIWIDDRENDPHVYTMEVAEPGKGGDDGENPDDPYKDYKLSDLLASDKAASVIGGHPKEKVAFIFNPGTDNEVEFRLDRIKDESKKLIELLNTTEAEKVTIRVYK